MKSIGFIGLGHMGNPMASNLLKAGFKLNVYDVVDHAKAALVEQGATPFNAVADLTEQSDIILSSVQTGDQVSSLCLGKEGIFNHAKEGLIYIDCSSIDIAVTKQLHVEAIKHNIRMLDAPVSGGVAAAKAATLTIMVGGEEADFHQAKDVLSAIGKRVIYAGHNGSGQAAKICNNLLLAISMIGVSEAFTLAKKLGLDQKKFFEISSNASGQCWSMTSYCPVPGIMENVPSSNNYEPGFMAKMMLKDLRLGQNAANNSSAAIPLGALAAELYDMFVNQGYGEKDFSAIINFIDGKESS